MEGRAFPLLVDVAAGDAEQALVALATMRGGLTADEAQRRLDELGPNAVRTPLPAA